MTERIPLRTYLEKKGVLRDGRFNTSPFLFDPFERYGLFMLRGKWSHSDGDEVANKILSGEISAEDAEKLHRKRQRYLNQMSNAQEGKKFYVR